MYIVCPCLSSLPSRVSDEPIADPTPAGSPGKRPRRLDRCCGNGSAARLAHGGAWSLLPVHRKHLEPGLVFGREQHTLRHEPLAEIAGYEVTEDHHPLADKGL